MSEDVQVGDQDEELPFLDDLDRTIYQWQMWADGVGELGQRKLKNARVLISRVGGVGGVVAYELAAAGVGKLVLAHGGTIKHSDLNRQLLMTYDRLGQSRVETARQRLLQLNPRIQVDVVDANINDENVDALVSQVDIVVDCAPCLSWKGALQQSCREDLLAWHVCRRNRPQHGAVNFPFLGPFLVRWVAWPLSKSSS